MIALAGSSDAICPMVVSVPLKLLDPFIMLEDGGENQSHQKQ
jgi:hypothetical protein